MQIAEPHSPRAPEKNLRKLRITGPERATYRQGDPIHVHDGAVLLCTLDPVPVSPCGTEIHVEHYTPPLGDLEESRHLGRLVFLERSAPSLSNASARCRP
ncbi:hypothetical protein C7T35_28050 [Variovorax sp. WS11]|nr:hypothetical protein C7T35_28050 [Variovorax sp. WS11]